MTSLLEKVKQYEAQKEAEAAAKREFQDEIMSGIRDLERNWRFAYGLNSEQYDMAVAYMKGKGVSLEEAARWVLKGEKSVLEAWKDGKALRVQTGYGGEGPAPQHRLDKKQLRRVKACTYVEGQDDPPRQPGKKELLIRPWWVVSEFALTEGRRPEQIVEEIFSAEGESEEQKRVDEIVEKRKKIFKIK